MTSPAGSFRTGFSPVQLAAYQEGVMSYAYRGVRCLKSPIDIAIYLRLITDERPATIIELGSKHGGSALMFRDFSLLSGAPAQVVSIDLRRPAITDQPGVEFLVGDVLKLESVFEINSLYDRPRPWLVVDDSAHTFASTDAVLNFFADHLRPGERLIVEDGVLTDMGLADRYDGGPNKAIAAFLGSRPGLFRIDRGCCDMFGRNMTYCPNGYLVHL